MQDNFPKKLDSFPRLEIYLVALAVFTLLTVAFWWNVRDHELKLTLQITVSVILALWILEIRLPLLQRIYFAVEPLLVCLTIGLLVYSLYFYSVLKPGWILGILTLCSISLYGIKKYL